MTPSLRAAVRDLRRAARWHRRLLAAGLAAGAVALSLSALSPAPPATVSIVVAARDLPGGIALSASDLANRQLPPAAVPAQTLTSASTAVGRVLVSAVRRGEPLTDLRLLGSPLLASLGSGRVAAPVRVADGAAVQLLRAGDTVDVVAATTTSGASGSGAGSVAGASAVVVAPAARVLLRPAPTEAGSVSDGALLVLAVDERTALALARAAMSARLSVLLRPP